MESLDPNAPGTSEPSTAQAFIVTRSTTVTFRAPGAAPPGKARVAPSNANSSAAEDRQSDGDLPGYEQIGGLEAQIEQIRELVEWPLTRPELFSHFGALA